MAAKRKKAHTKQPAPHPSEVQKQLKDAGQETAPPRVEQRPSYLPFW